MVFNLKTELDIQYTLEWVRFTSSQSSSLDRAFPMVINTKLFLAMRCSKCARL
jgi:hypothetical protein